MVHDIVGVPCGTEVGNTHENVLHLLHPLQHGMDSF